MAKRPPPDLGRAEIPAIAPTMPSYLSPRDLAQRLKVSPLSIKRLMKEGLPYIRISERKVRFDPGKASEWLAKRTVTK
jgi:hypothetical protein